MKNVLQRILKMLAILTVKRYKPKVVGITGSVGKTSAKDAVYVVLSKKFNVRKTEKSFNNEIGFPLTILGEKSCGKNLLCWSLVFIKSLLKLIYTKYPEILVLEYGVDRPGNMEYLLDIIKPNVAVVTAIGELPVHVENFPNKRALVKEKADILKYLTNKDTALLNIDDKTVFDMKNKTKADVLTFGFSKNANFKIFEPEKREGTTDDVKVPLGISFKVEYKGVMIPVRLDGLYGRQSAYAASIACLVGESFGINLVEASESLKEFRNPPGRLNLIEGVNNTFILDDTYNASPLSVEAGLMALKDLSAKRKVAVLGSMLELGEFSEKAHRYVGDIAASFCDVIVTVGKEAEATKKELEKTGFKNAHHFNSSEELLEKMKDLMEPGDLILVKGSQGVRLEKVVKKIMAHPEDAEKLLARQGREWG